MKLKAAERQKLKQLVADSILCRLTEEETVDYIEKSLGLRFCIRYIRYVKGWLRRDMQDEFVRLRQDKYAYIHEYLQRINEIKDLQRNTRIIMGKATDWNLRLKCISELHSLSLSLANLYDLLPAITERSFYNAASPLSSNSEMVPAVPRDNAAAEITITAASPRSEDTEII
jgi:hypothetical protein